MDGAKNAWTEKAVVFCGIMETVNSKETVFAAESLYMDCMEWKVNGVKHLQRLHNATSYFKKMEIECTWYGALNLKLWFWFGTLRNGIFFISISDFGYFTQLQGSQSIESTLPSLLQRCSFHSLSTCINTGPLLVCLLRQLCFPALGAACLSVLCLHWRWCGVYGRCRGAGWYWVQVAPSELSDVGLFRWAWVGMRREGEGERQPVLEGNG